jgi:dTMP kinase
LTLFATFEGTEGSGKTTQIRLLAAALERLGCRVLPTREPGGTELGEALRRLLLESSVSIGAEAEAYLMTAARAEHVRRVIRPALEAGTVVLCDRFSDSTLAYQGAGRGLPVDVLRDMQRLAVGTVHPTLTVLLDVPPEVGLLRRARENDANRIDREAQVFHERVAAWYRAEAFRDPGRWVVVDGTQPPDLVHTAIMQRVTDYLDRDAAVHRGGVLR